MELELRALRREREHLVVQHVEARLLGEEASRAPTRETCVSTGTSRAPKLKSSTHAAVLRPTPGRAVSSPSGASGPAVCSRWSQRERITDRVEDRLDADALDLRDPAGPDRLLDLLHRRVADGLPRSEPLAEAQVGDVAVAVVGRLAEDGEDQLVERRVVRGQGGDAVGLAQLRAEARGTRARPTAPSPARPPPPRRAAPPRWPAGRSASPRAPRSRSP